jgi:hypothetical protein
MLNILILAPYVFFFLFVLHFHHTFLSLFFTSFLSLSRTSQTFLRDMHLMGRDDGSGWQAEPIKYIGIQLYLNPLLIDRLMGNIAGAGVAVVPVCYTNVYDDCKEYLTTYACKCDVRKLVGYTYKYSNLGQCCITCLLLRFAAK